MSLAVSQGGAVISEMSLVRDGIDDLVVLLEELLSKVTLRLTDVSEWVVLQGPGSYAGIRTGLATIKTLALLSNARVKGLNTLEVLAYGARWYEGLIIVAMEARKDELNFALFGGGKDWNIVLAHETIKTTQLAKKLQETKGDYIVVGDWREVPEGVASRFSVMHPQASVALELAASKPAVELKRLNPIYAYPVNVTKPKRRA
jgi:tRNA threonylcarbamoyladenosine biosynthesis protein TsaB